MTIIGVDPSINSTGICINQDNKFIYYIITSKMTRKMQNFKSDIITLLPYDKLETKDLDYCGKEDAKTKNLYAICNYLSRIVDDYHPDLVQMEGVSYGSTGSAALVDLSGLNFMLRSVLLSKGIDFKIVSPTQNKKFATGNGQAEKDVMIDSWKRLDHNIYNIKDIKVDDLADAYFLSCYSD